MELYEIFLMSAHYSYILNFQNCPIQSKNALILFALRKH